MWRILIPHILEAIQPSRLLDDVVGEVSDLLSDAGDYHLNRGRRDDDDHILLNKTNRFALVLSELGEFERARALDEDTLARRRRVLGEDHPDTVALARRVERNLDT